MMLFRNHPILSLLASAVMSHQSLACSECPCDAMSIDCIPVDAPPTLDGNTDEWSIFNTTLANYPLTSAMGASRYPHGDGSASIQCVYDTDKVYFLFKVPGPYRFNNTDNHQCAAVSSMFKMGANAQLYNMGGCPLALNDCPAEEGACDDYKVDIGGHWELKTTEQGVYYTTNGGTGDDVVANKDDEYSVSPYCRMDDDDGLAANEWEGAWVYVDEATEDDIGSYTFEMARALKTVSDETDAQLEAGTEIDFGFAFWDPYEDDSTGWSDAGHYVTGCSSDWITLRLLDEHGDTEDEEQISADQASTTGETSADGSNAAAESHGSGSTTIASVSFATFVMAAVL